MLYEKKMSLELVQTITDSLGDDEVKSIVYPWVNLLLQKESLAVDGGLAQAYKRKQLSTITATFPNLQSKR
jgi:hypothetical protein